jgi:hypothetical protein
MAASAAATTLALTPQHIKCFGIGERGVRAERQPMRRGGLICAAALDAAKVFRDSPSRVASLDLSDDGELMVAACEDCSIRVFSIAQPALRKQVFAKKLGAALARFTHHDQAVLVASARSVGRTGTVPLGREGCRAVRAEAISHRFARGRQTPQTRFDCCRSTTTSTCVPSRATRTSERRARGLARARSLAGGGAD